VVYPKFGAESARQNSPSCRRSGTFDLHRFRLFFQLAAQPGAGESPFPFDRCMRDLEHSGYLFDREAGEKAKLDYLAVARVHLGELFQRIVQRNEVHVGLAEKAIDLAEREPVLITSAFLSASFAGAVNKYVAHQSGGQPEELRAPLETHVPLVDHPQVGLVYKRRRFQSNIVPFSIEVRMGYPAKFLIHKWHEFIGRRLVAAGPSPEKLSDGPAASQVFEPLALQSARPECLARSAASLSKGGRPINRQEVINTLQVTTSGIHV
jgi:hypothetical protein